MTYRIAVCDDCAADQNYIIGIVTRWADACGHTLQIDAFSSAEQFLFQYTAQKNFDILLLDIEMGGMDGVTLAEQLRAQNETAQIVFITGFPDFMARGFEVSALHYLMKPVMEKKLCSVLDKAVSNLSKTERSVLLPVEDALVRIPIDQILYVEATAHNCEVVTKTETLTVKQSISQLSELLGEQFISTHRSYLVNLTGMYRIGKNEIVLTGGLRIPISRSRQKAVNEAFLQYYRKDWKGER